MRALLPAILAFSLPLCAAGPEHFAPGQRPDVSGLGFVLATGKEKTTISEHKGKVIVVDFWTTWCPPCRASLPELHSLQKEGEDKGTFLVIPINMDEDRWPLDVRRFMKKNEGIIPGFKFYRAATGAQGPGRILPSPIEAFPTTLIIDREGRLAARWSGYGAGTLEAELQAILKEASPAQ